MLLIILFEWIDLNKKLYDKIKSSNHYFLVSFETKVQVYISLILK